MIFSSEWITDFDDNQEIWTDCLDPLTSEFAYPIICPKASLREARTDAY